MSDVMKQCPSCGLQQRAAVLSCDCGQDLSSVQPAETGEKSAGAARLFVWTLQVLLGLTVANVLIGRIGSGMNMSAYLQWDFDRVSIYSLFWVPVLATAATMALLGVAQRAWAVVFSIGAPIGMVVHVLMYPRAFDGPTAFERGIPTTLGGLLYVGVGCLVWLLCAVAAVGVVTTRRRPNKSLAFSAVEIPWGCLVLNLVACIAACIVYYPYKHGQITYFFMPQLLLWFGVLFTAFHPVGLAKKRMAVINALSESAPHSESSPTSERSKTVTHFSGLAGALACSKCKRTVLPMSNGCCPGCGGSLVDVVVTK